MKKWWFCLVIPMVLTACNYKTNAYKSLEQEKDSLLLMEQKKTAQLNQVLSVVNLIEDNFEEILQAENVVTFQTNQEVMVEDSMQLVVNNLDLIKNSLMDNRKKIESLKEQLSKNKNTSKDLKGIIERLNQKLEEHTQTITALQQQLALKDIRIAELDGIVAELSTTLSDVREDVAQKETTIRSQESQLNKVWYVFGTRKELKSQDIFTRNGMLEEGFNKNYFLEADARKLTEIALYSKKAKLLTNHPSSSYELEKINEYLTLKIIDPQKFWEISRYLVIEVD